MANLKKNSKSADLAVKTAEEILQDDIPELGDVVVAEDGTVEDNLLCGYVDEDGVRHTTFKYREMNGKDEEALNKSDVRQNPAKLTNTLAERCVVSIGSITKKDLGTSAWSALIRKLMHGDLDYISVKVRELSKGDIIKITHKCSECGASLQTEISTHEFNIKPFLGLDTIPFKLKRGYRDKAGKLHLTGVLRPMNGLDREILVPMFKKNASVGKTMMLTRLMSFDDEAIVTQEQVSLMSLIDRDYLEDLLNDNAFGVDTNVEITCTSCNAEISTAGSRNNFL